MTEIKQVDFIKALLARNIIQFKDTTLSSGRHSPYYIDCRAILQHNDLTEYVLAQYMKVLATLNATGEKYNKLAGVAMAGIPWTTLVGNRLNVPVMFIRPSAKTHGSKSAIDGANLEFDDNIVLLEDVLTTGSSVIEAIRKIHNRGGNVVRVICILDRNEGAQEHIKYYFPEVKVTTLITLDQLLTTYQNANLISDYYAEQTEFYREKGYTETIRLLTKLNDDAKDKPYMLDPVSWHMKHYPATWNINKVKVNADIQPEQSNLFVDITGQTDWKLVKYKLGELGYTVRNLVIDFESFQDWNTDKQRELLALRTKYGFNIIYRPMLCVPGYNSQDVLDRNLINKLTTTNPATQKYPNYLLCNGGIILNVYVIPEVNGPVLAKLLFAELAKLDITTGMHAIKCQHIYLNFIGPGILQLLNDMAFWQEFRTNYMNIIDNKFIKLAGLIFPYHELIDTTSPGNNISLPAKLKISRLIPVILDIGTNNPFYLEKSMLTDTPGQDFAESINGLTKFYNANCVTHLLVGQDLMDANIPIGEKRVQYIQLIKQLNHKKLFSLDTIITYFISNGLFSTCTELVDDVFSTYDKELAIKQVNKQRKTLDDHKLIKPADMFTKMKDYTTGFVHRQVSMVLKYFGFELAKID